MKTVSVNNTVVLLMDNHMYFSATCLSLIECDQYRVICNALVFCIDFDFIKNVVTVL